MALSRPCSPWPQHTPRYGTPHPQSLRVQVTPAAFVWVQGWSLRDPLGQNMRKDSFPTHCSSLSRMAPTPSPKSAALGTDRAAPHCNSPQTTSAALGPKSESQTVFHWFPSRISMRPEQGLSPPTSRTNPGAIKVPREFPEPSGSYMPTSHLVCKVATGTEPHDPPSSSQGLLMAQTHQGHPAAPQPSAQHLWPCFSPKPRAAGTAHTNCCHFGDPGLPGSTASTWGPGRLAKALLAAAA